MPFFDIKEGSGWFVTLRITAETPQNKGFTKPQISLKYSFDYF